MDFINYEDIAGRGAMFKYVVEKNLMPPWYVDPNTGPFEEDVSLTLQEKALLLKWAESGFPKRKKKRKSLLWPVKKVKTSKPPDYVISMPEQVVVPAEGFSIYKRFFIHAPFKEDKWIKDVRFILKPKVIHHFGIYIMDPSYRHDPQSFDYHTKAINFIRNSEFKGDEREEYNRTLYKEAGIRLAKHSPLILEIHYEPIGREVTDHESRVHIYFHKKPPKYDIITHYYYALNINIPPYRSLYKVRRTHQIKEDMVLVGLNTHMHLRGKASSVFVTDPNGVRKRIFGLDPFTKAFERLYTLKKPIVITKGSTIECINWFDNSAKNTLNPAPEKFVTEGLFLKDEMSNCIFKRIVPANKSHSKYIFWKFLQ